MTSDHRDGQLREAPTIFKAEQALSDLKIFQCGPERKKRGIYRPLELCKFVEHQVRSMIALLSLYTCSHSLTCGQWGASSFQASVSIGCSSMYCAWVLRKLCHAYISDREILLISLYAGWQSNMLLDEDLKSDVVLFLHSLRSEDISAKTLQDYLIRSDVQDKHGIACQIAVTTANQYL
jgi:hypothetical protein